MSRKELKGIMGLLNGSNSLPSRQAIAGIKHVKNQLNLMQDRNEDPGQIGKVRSAAFDSLTLDLIDSNRAEAARLNNQLLQLKEIYVNNVEKNYSKRSRDIENAKRKFSSMSMLEIEEEALNIMGSKLTDEILPENMEELSIALKINNSEIFDSFRKYLKGNNYDQPWVNSIIGSDLKGDIDFITSNVNKLMLKTPDGRRGAVSFDDLDSFVEVSEEVE